MALLTATEASAESFKDKVQALFDEGLIRLKVKTARPELTGRDFEAACWQEFRDRVRIDWFPKRRAEVFHEVIVEFVKTKHPRTIPYFK